MEYLTQHKDLVIFLDKAAHASLTHCSVWSAIDGASCMAVHAPYSRYTSSLGRMRIWCDVASVCGFDSAQHHDRGAIKEN
jgi:hypothetical protein